MKAISNLCRVKNGTSGEFKVFILEVLPNMTQFVFFTGLIYIFHIKLYTTLLIYMFRFNFKKNCQSMKIIKAN